MFQVNLIKVPPLASMSGADVFDLMVNARWIGGDYWFFEGEIYALLVGGRSSVVATGVTDGVGDMSDDEFRKHCEEIFGVSLADAPRSWEMV